MKEILLFQQLSLLFLFFFSVSAKAGGQAPPPAINEVSVLSPNVEQYGQFEAIIGLTATFFNPYDYSQIAVRGAFTSPSGLATAVDGFFMQDYALNANTGNLTPSGQPGFRLRFSPNELGTWSFIVSVTDNSGTATSALFTFQCIDVSAPANHGFLRTTQSNYLQFDDGTPYIAIGENIAWQNNNPYLNYKTWLNGLIQNGGNFFRLWHAHWGLGIEWGEGNGFLGLRQYHQANCFYQDWLFDFCAENGIYIMLTLQHHGQVSTQVDPNWADNPYNVANSGPCQNTLEFFTNEAARDHTKNRYRYIVARWGYARSILGWELFNEVHWTDNFQANKDLVAQWHFEMADYLKSIDPNSHLVTTSYGNGLTDEMVWSHPDLSFTQTHTYINTPNIERVIGNANRTYLDAFGKPTLNGEFGLGGGLGQQDPDGIHFHNALWGGLFSGAFGTAMTWWWENYIHPRNLYYHFSGISLVAGEVPFLDRQLAPASTYVTGAPGDLVLTPLLGWSGIGEDEVSIDENGTVSPEGAALAQFLYGSQWNTQYRSPPTFNVNYALAGEFSVTTGSETGTGPKIAIWLDGNLQAEQNANPNSSYTINVPAGAHTIKVDNTGTDWITIASYAFEGLGSQVDTYVLVSADKNIVAGWALNNHYNHQYVAANGEPGPTPPSSLIVEDFQDGTYAVRWFNPLTGLSISNDVAVASSGILSIPMPSFLWDVAFIVDDSPVATLESKQALAFGLYPNPASLGAEVNVNLPSGTERHSQIALLDMEGREVRRYTDSNGRFQPTAELPAGIYWVKVESEGRTGVRALVLTR